MTCEQKEKLNKILADIGDKFPRNIVDICNKMGLDVEETEDFSNDISGLIYKKDDKYIILVNAFHKIGRKSFTIAHELGHFVLHKQLLDEKSEIVSYTKSKEEDIFPALPRCETNYNCYETEANKFAANILMPEDEFIKICDEVNSIEEIAAYFGVSIQAATIRAQKVKGIFFL